MTRRHPLPRIFWLWLLAVVMAASNTPRSFGQTNRIQALPNYATKLSAQRLYYDPPDQDKVKFEILGNGSPSAAGVIITDAKIKTFSVNGGPPQLIAETVSCLLNISASQISSSNLLQARSGDGNFYVEGVGFLYQKAMPDLTLSNRVHTIIHQVAPENSGKTDSITDIYADHGTFDTKGGLVTYHDHVKVVDPQLHLTCVMLTAQMAQSETNHQLDHIIAETNVVMDFIDDKGRKTHATSDKAVYIRTIDSVTNELLTLTGHPRLETSNGWSTADTFVMNRTTGKIRGTGNCHFHSRMALDAATTNTPSLTEISADNFDYDMKTGQAVYRDNVRVDNPQLKLVCETLTAQFPEGSGKAADFNNIVAEKNVAIDYFDDHGEKTRAVAEKAVYSSSVANGVTNKVLDLTGNPVLERTNGWIIADLISMDRLHGTIRAEGNQHTIFKRQPGQVGKSTAPPKSAETEIFSDYLNASISNGVALYRGNVRAMDPQMQLQCQQLMIKVPQGSASHGGRPERIVAETNVIVDYLSGKGEKTHATGEKMVFTHSVTNATTTNEVMELTGNPVVDMINDKGEKSHAKADKMVYTSTTGDKPGEFVTLSGHPSVERTDDIMTSDGVMIYNRTTGQAVSVGEHNHINLTLKPGAAPKTNAPPELSTGPEAH